MPDPFAVANSILSDLIFLDLADQGSVSQLSTQLRALGSDFTGSAAILAVQAADALDSSATDDERRNRAAALLEQCLQAAEAAAVVISTDTPSSSEVALDHTREEFLERAEASLRDLDPRAGAAAYRRKLHSLKGDAGVVGLRDEALVCHAMEDFLAQGGHPNHLENAVRWLSDSFAARRFGTPPPSPNIIIASLRRTPPLGETLIAEGLVDQSTISAALNQQAHLTPGRPLGEILVDAGHLDPRQLEAILGGPVTIPHRVDPGHLQAWDEAWRTLHQVLGHLPLTTAQRQRLRRSERNLLTARERLLWTTARGLLERLARVAQDTARVTGVELHLDLEGATTALDRQVSERLAEALPHVIRNAVDHGIEPPHERLAAGKPRHGILTIQIKAQVRSLLVTVTDDGRGIDRAKLLAKAELPADTVLDDEALWRLLCRPGLSTAATITAVSGRGIGLDVVADLEVSLGANIRLQTNPGKGTEFRISIPPTNVKPRSTTVPLS